MVDSRAGIGKYKLSLEHLVVSKSKEILNKKRGGCDGNTSDVKRAEANLKAVQWPKLEPFEQKANNGGIGL